MARKYQIQGFPTIKVFGDNKKSPSDYQGQRTADGIVTEAMKQASSLVKDRKSGKKSSSSSDKKEKKEKKEKKGSGSDVIELTGN